MSARFLIALALSLSAGASAAPEPAAAEIKGGRVYRSLFDAGGAKVAVWRWAASGERVGPPILIVPELGFSKLFYEKLASALQAREREVFLVEWRGTGESSAPARGAGGLEALFLGDAPAALDVVLQATKARQVVLLGHGLGGAASAFLASGARKRSVAGLILAMVPGAWEVPNEALRRLGESARVRQTPPDRPVSVRTWAEQPPTVPSRMATDLYELVLAHGNGFGSARKTELRAALGTLAPELLRDLWRWMDTRELVLPAGPLQEGGVLSAAWGALAQPLLVIAAPRDNLVHPEHTFALRKAAPGAKQAELCLQRIEGYEEDAGHLALSSDRILHDLVPQLAEWHGRLP